MAIADIKKRKAIFSVKDFNEKIQVFVTTSDIPSNNVNKVIREKLSS